MVESYAISGSGFETAGAFACLPLPRFMARWKVTRIAAHIDLTGQKFYNLTPVEWIPAHDGIKGIWKCRCDCGKYTFVSTADLNRATTKSCGCMAKTYIRDGHLEDLTGQRFGRLVAQELIIGQDWNAHRWKCVCDCGNIAFVRASNLKKGVTTSCGCYRTEVIRRSRAHKYSGEYTSKHTPVLYSMWISMRRRCNCPSEPSYKNYGGRGISICDEWYDFETFQTWAYSHGYEKGLTIDRIDVDGDYCPENCRWADWYVQGNNRRNNVKYEFQGESHTLSEWSRILGYNRATLVSRIMSGWPIEKAFTAPVAPTHVNQRIWTYQGETHRVYEWAEITGIPKNILFSRYKGGRSAERALTTPPKTGKAQP